MKLSDICKYRNEKINLKDINENEYVSTDNMLPNFAGLGELKSFPNVDRVSKFCRNDILLSNIRPYFKKMILSDNNSGCSSDVLVIETINKDVNPKFLYYRLRLDDFFDYVILTSKGTKMPRGDKKAIMNFELEVPRLDIQNKIVKIIENIDKKIELNNKINNNLYEFNNKLFEEKILNNAEKDDWEEYLLSDISKMINGYSYKGNELVEKSNIGMATIKNFERTGGFKLDGFKDIVPQKCKNDHYVKLFEILVACTDLTQNADIIGNAIMLLNNANYDEIIMSMDLVKLIPITDIVNNYMLYAIVNSKDFKNFALRYKSGTTVLHLNKNCFKEYTIKLPNYNTIKDLSKVFEGNYKKISQIVDENRKLEQLRDTLLPKLMNGEIDLYNIEI